MARARTEAGQIDDVNLGAAVLFAGTRRAEVETLCEGGLNYEACIGERRMTSWLPRRDRRRAGALHSRSYVQQVVLVKADGSTGRIDCNSTTFHETKAHALQTRLGMKLQGTGSLACPL